MIDPATTPTITVYSSDSTRIDLAQLLVQDVRTCPASPSTELAADSAELWQIKNKYYSAWVKFKRETGQQHDLTDDESPAVIVVVPRTQSPPPELAAQLAAFAARDPEFDVALLVSYATPRDADADTSSGASSPDEEAWEDLAFEHAFEWVDVAPDGGTSDAEAEEGTEDRGIGRVVAALHAHMWENMLQADRPEPPPKATTPAGECGVDSEEVDSEDEAEFAALGAPPLPEPKPFVPVPVAFPATMLPSLAKNAGKAHAETANIAPPAPAASNAPTGSPAPAATASTAAAAATTATAFEDDFAPFVPPAETFSSFAFASPPARATAGAFNAADGFELLNDEDGRAGGTEDELDLSGDDDGLSELVARLKGMREEARGLGLDERRALAERAVMGLLGE